MKKEELRSFSKKIRQDAFYGFEWTPERIEAEALQIAKTHPKSKQAVSLVMTEVELLRECYQDTNPDAVETAILLGMRWASLAWQVGMAGPGGNPPDPVWEHIRAVHDEFPGWQQKRKIIEGLRRCHGEACVKRWSEDYRATKIETCQKHFKKRIQTHPKA